MNEHSVELRRKIALIVHELKTLRSVGPRFRIIHRSGIHGALDCVVGEEVAAVYLLSRSRAFFVNLALSQRLLFDNLAKHVHVPRSASQISASMRVEKFYTQHGKNIFGRSLTRRFGPTSTKEYVKRLRLALALAFDEAKISIDPASVLVSEPTTSNQVNYVLRAMIEWQHVDT
jgi:hypothetical protein